MKLKVGGMSCSHCSQSVTAAVTAVPGVTRADVDLRAGEVTVSGEADEAAIRSAIEDAGFEAGPRL